MWMGNTAFEGAGPLVLLVPFHERDPLIAAAHWTVPSSWIQATMALVNIVGTPGIAFMVPGDPNPAGCDLTYTRKAATVLGGKTEIPEFTTTVHLN